LINFGDNKIINCFDIVTFFQLIFGKLFLYSPLLLKEGWPKAGVVDSPSINNQPPPHFGVLLLQKGGENEFEKIYRTRIGSE